MEDVQPFGLLVLVIAAVGLVAVLSNRLSERLQVPTPAFFLAGAALAAHHVDALHAPPHRTVERLVTIALVVILFDGGMHLGWRRVRAAAVPIGVTGVVGTFLTTAAVAALAHWGFDLDWYLAVLVGTAVAPTDPAVVFSVLGQRELGGRSGTILEGESGANDPVGIALMASLITAGGLGAGAAGDVAGEFLLQMLVGGAVGLVGGRLLLEFVRRVPLPSEGLYPLRTLAGAMLLFGLATVAHGSGFLAVFVAGILLGDANAPYKREIRRFHASLASLGEIVAFVVLGLTVDLGVLSDPDVWVPGLLIGGVLALVVRPVLVGLCLLPVDLTRNERAFVLLAGLKGAVPILLGSFILTAEVPQAERLYGIVVVVVVLSVVVQGGLVPTAVRLLRLPMRIVAPEPWTFGVRLQDEPEGAHQYTVARGSAADGRALQELGDDLWVSFVVRDGRLVPAAGETRLQAGDDVMVLAEPAVLASLHPRFETAV
ncbi:MAG: cvrA [Frankiales bacterium]|nr:cvrA [Frankiales bacterium]